VLDVVLDVLAPANAIETRNETNRVIGLDHDSQAATRRMPAASVLMSWLVGENCLFLVQVIFILEEPMHSCRDTAEQAA
jgi:hypothetical protein